MNKVCVISQPTFLPWIGWFDMADQADVMVILDDVAFSKRSWQQRNRIRTPSGLEFLTVPVKSSGRFGQQIVDCELDDRKFVVKMLKTIKMNYARAPYFADIFSELEACMEAGAASGKLADLNIALILWLARKLDVDTPMIRSNDMHAGGSRGNHLASICEAVGADTYLSAVGAESYLLQDREYFELRHIPVFLHSFQHPEYSQCFQPFIPFASALDLVFNIGPMAGSVMRSGRRSPRPLGELAPESTTKGSLE